MVGFVGRVAPVDGFGLVMADEGVDGVQYLAGSDDQGYANPVSSGMTRVGAQSSPRLDVSQLVDAWWDAFGADAVRVSVLLRRAHAVPLLGQALGDPPPSARSLGRLLAAREGLRVGNLELVRCPGRHDNCALWRLRPVEPRERRSAVGSSR